MYAYYEHFVPTHNQPASAGATQEIRLLEAIAEGLVPQQPTKSSVVRLLGNFPSRKLRKPHKN